MKYGGEVGGMCYVLGERGHFLRGKEPLLASCLLPCMTKPVQSEVP